MNSLIRNSLIDEFNAPILLYNLHKQSYWPSKLFDKNIAKAVVDLIIVISAGNETIETLFS